MPFLFYSISIGFYMTLLPISWWALQSVCSSLIGGRWFVPYFIVEFDCVLEGIVLFEGVVGAGQLFHCASHSQPCWFCFTLGDGPTGDTSTNVFLAISTAGLRLSLEPFVLFYDPSGDHVVVGVLVSRAQVNRLPAIRLKRLFEYIL